MKLLVIKPSSLGDIIHGLVAIESLRQAKPDVTVTWVVRDIFEPFVRNCKTVDKTLVYKRSDGWRGFKMACQALRADTFDAVLDLQGLLRSGIMMACARSDRKIGRADAREGAHLFYNEKPQLPRTPKAHAVEILLRFLPLFGVPARIQGNISFKKPTTEHFPEVTQGCILFFPNSRRPEKEWPDFEALTRWFLCSFPQYTAVWAGDKSGPIPQSLENQANFIDLRGIVPIELLPELFERARLVIANDSGPVHLAAAMGKEVIGLYGSTDSALYGPYPLNCPKNHVIQAPNGDLKALKTEAVAEVITEILL